MVAISAKSPPVGCYTLAPWQKRQTNRNWAAANEQRAASVYSEELKTLFLGIAAQYRDLAEQLDDPEQWRAKHRGRQN
jgi:hypothetical protein